MGQPPSKRSRQFPDTVTVEQIETEIEKMTAEGARTEAWMSARARREMQQFEEKDAALRRAYAAGYRRGSDNSFLAPIFGVSVAGIIIGIVYLARDFIMPLL